jgi:hypothetical protein
MVVELRLKKNHFLIMKLWSNLDWLGCDGAFEKLIFFWIIKSGLRQSSFV